MKKSIFLIIMALTCTIQLFAQQVESVTGKVTLLRVNPVGGAFGPPADRIDAEVIIKLNTKPDNAYGFQLRKDNNELTHEAMFEMLQYAYANNLEIKIEYTRLPNRKNFILFRVILEK